MGFYFDFVGNFNEHDDTYLSLAKKKFFPSSPGSTRRLLVLNCCSAKYLYVI